MLQADAGAACFAGISVDGSQFLLTVRDGALWFLVHPGIVCRVTALQSTAFVRIRHTEGQLLCLVA